MILGRLIIVLNDLKLNSLVVEWIGHRSCHLCVLEFNSRVM